MTILKTNTDVALQIKITGADSLASLICGEKSWSVFTPEIEVRDDLAGRIYLASNAVCSEIAAGKLCYTWPDADLSLTEQWSSDGTALNRTISITLKPGAKKRSISVMELIPYPAHLYNWQTWTAFESFPTEVQWVGWRKMFYGDPCYGTVFPCFSLYSPEEDRGILLGVPHGQLPGGRLSFMCRDYHSEGIEIEFSNLLLSDERSVVCPLILAGQHGDFRCSLAFWKSRFPDYFERPLPRLQEEAGPFLMTNPELKNETLDRMTKDFSPAWAEIHNQFSKYGEYAPETDSWESIIKHDYSKDWTGEPMTIEKVNRHISELKKRNIFSMLYLQCSGDCFIPYAKEKFPEDIALDAGGNLIPTWKECCFVSAMKGTAFYHHILQQIDRFLVIYPQIDGVFLDQLCYQALDFAHKDGKTAIRNQEVSDYGNTYLDTLPYLSRKLHEKGLTLWANGPFSLDVAKDVDGMMSEGAGTMAKTFQYMTIGSKSLLIASYATSAEDVEQMFRHCLLCGGNYSIGGSFSAVAVPEYSERINFLLQKCGALVKLLAGCQWVLVPKPFHLPDIYDGNLFHLPDNSLALTVVSKWESLTQSNGNIAPAFTAKISCGCQSVISVEEFSINGRSQLSWELKDNMLQIQVTGHNVFSVILIKAIFNLNA